ncbi:serine protease FAM111A isoform X1 [Carassius gibelio]|uniref:serine protease FAM111A isoform X1 n=1 Tax=Carassius gibelio TaxID=101364 RepID=UPI002279915C|nr:serine protease FAM111A isoform X1 [Carassius gibelio]XP_052454458.1 serine protease FAM111A isoform X1 [Carassius gibelio]XP_052454459.1 serine protease FAM111A isoform X1 [Carassius gibelio]
MNIVLNCLALDCFPFQKRQPESNTEDRRASQAAGNAQEKNHVSKKKEKGLGTNGREPLKERTNQFCKEKVEEGQSKSHLQQSAEGQSHTFNFRYKSEKFEVACDTSKTVLDALNTNKIFRKIKKDNKEKEIVIQRSKGAVHRAAIKTDFPCCLVEKNELLDISFIKSHENVATKKKTTGRLSFSNESKGFVIFYIKTKGGEKVKRLMKNNELRMKVEDVCVYAFKDDKLNAALRRDGRFSNDIFKKQCVLYNLESETKYEMSKTVEHLDGKHFKIIVISDINQPDSQDFVSSDDSAEMNEASAADLKENVDHNEPPINTEQEETQKKSTVKSTKPIKPTKTNSPKIIPQSEEVLAILRAQFKDLLEILMQRENLKKKTDIKKFFRAEYDKSVQSFLEVKKVKQLMTLSDSVCQIRVEGSARGTGFLLFDRFILTNAHVVGEYDPFTRKLSKDFTAVFGYEDLKAENTRCVPVKEHLAAYYHGYINKETYLDFALLELKDADEMADRPGLLSRYIHGPPPNRGGICIVGHPGEGVKKIDPCFIIGKENLQEAADKHILENFNFIHVMTQQYLAEKWELHDNQIIYDSCFFHGSSGSPVFDEDCYLIGVHTGGYAYKGEKCKTRSIMEYAYSMQPILECIITQAKERKRSDILKLLSEHKSFNPNLEDNDVDMEEDPQNQEDFI